MKILLTFLLIVCLLSCSSRSKTQENDHRQKNLTQSSTLQLEKPFDFSKFLIEKRKLGNIEIGMTIFEAEVHFKGLKKIEDEAANLGYGGGSSSFLYYFDDEIIFALIPRAYTDTITLIVAIHKHLRTNNGLSPNSSVQDLLEVYPDLVVYPNQITLTEFAIDKENEWYFEFGTDVNNQIGEYDGSNFDGPSRPTRLDIKASWIEIK